MRERSEEKRKPPSQVESRGIQTSIQQLPERWDVCWDSVGSAGSVHIGAQEQGDLSTGKAKAPW